MTPLDMPDKHSIVQQIKQLCIEHRYDEAIAITNKIKFNDLAIEAHLLCIEHEQACIKDGSYKPTKPRLHITSEWLKNKIETMSDDDCEARGLDWVMEQKMQEDK